MNQFIIADGFPYLVAGDKAYAVRWDDSGFTVGSEVPMPSNPGRLYSELSILAKCQGRLDSIALQDRDKPSDDKAKRTRKKSVE